MAGPPASRRSRGGSAAPSVAPAGRYGSLRARARQRSLPTRARRAASPPPGTRNLRDVGGYPAGDGRETRWRTLLRTDALDQLPVASQQALHVLRVRQVIDVRWAHEMKGRPSVFRDSDELRYRNMRLMPVEAVPDGIAARPPHVRHALDGARRKYPGTRGAPRPPGGHRLRGRVNQTSVAVALLLSAVGVPAEVVAADYALSGRELAIDGAASGLADWRGGRVRWTADPNCMFEALDHLERVHGGAPALLARNGFGDRDLGRLRELLPMEWNIRGS